MTDNTSGSTTTSILIQKLLTTSSWDETFSLLEQEYTCFASLDAVSTLFDIIEEKQRQDVRPAEIDLLGKYLSLLGNLREWSLPVAWENFILSLLDEEAMSVVGAAFVELENASTDADIRQVFERDRSLSK